MHLTHLILGGLICVLGFSIYLYLPVRSMQNPYYDWGNPETPENFINHILDKKDKGIRFSYSSINKLLRQMKHYVHLVLKNFGYLGVLSIIVGFYYLYRWNKKFLILLLLYFFSEWWFYIPGWQDAAHYVPSFIFLATLAGIGILTLVKISTHLTSHQNTYTFLIVLCTFVQIASNAVASYKDCDKSIYYNAHQFFKDRLKDINYGGIVFESDYFFGCSCLQRCEQYRQDITTINIIETFAPALYTPICQDRFPLIHIPLCDAKKAGESIVNANINRHDIYFGPETHFYQAVAPYLVPSGFFLNLSPQKQHTGNNNHHEYFLTQSASSFDMITKRNIPSDREEALLYEGILVKMGIFFLYYTPLPGEPLKWFETAAILNPNYPVILNLIGSTFARLNKHKESVNYFEQAVAQLRENTYLNNLAYAYIDTGKIEKSASLFYESLSNNPQDLRAIFGLGVFYSKTGDYKSAYRYFKQCIHIASPKSVTVKEAIKELKLLKDSST